MFVVIIQHSIAAHAVSHVNGTQTMPPYMCNYDVNVSGVRLLICQLFFLKPFTATRNQFNALITHNFRFLNTLHCHCLFRCDSFFFALCLLNCYKNINDSGGKKKKRSKIDLDMTREQCMYCCSFLFNTLRNCQSLDDNRRIEWPICVLLCCLLIFTVL